MKVERSQARGRAPVSSRGAAPSSRKENVAARVSSARPQSLSADSGAIAAALDADARLHAVLRCSGIWYWRLDQSYRFVVTPFDNAENTGQRLADYLGTVAWERPYVGLPSDDFERWKAAMLAREPFRDLVYLRPSMDGKYRWVRISGEPIYDERGQFLGYHGVGQDITEREQAQQKIRRLSALYAALSHTNEAITRLTTPRELYDEVCRVAVEFGGCSMAGIALISPETGLLTPVAAAGNDVLFRGLTMALDTAGPEAAGPTATAIRAGSPYVCMDIATDPRAHPWREPMLDAGFHSSVNAPLRHGGTVIGALVLYAAEVNFFDHELVELIQKMSRNVSFALDAIEESTRRAEAKQQLRLALDASDQGLWDWNFVTCRIYHDSTTARILGCAAEREGDLELWRRSVHPEDIAGLTETVHQNIIGNTELFQAEYRLLRDSGAILWVGLRGRVIERSPDGRALRMVGIIQDISERKRSEDRLSFLAQYDVLTGLPNRSLFRDRLSLAITRAKRNRMLVGLLALDLDRFNQINDTLGHALGDRVLQEVSARLREGLREVDTIARLSGDEFTLIVEETDDPVQLATIAEKVRWVLAAPLAVDGHEIFLTPSIGVTIFPRDSEHPEELLKNADIAMYRAKRQGGNTHVFYSPEMASKSIERLSLESELRRALDRDELVLHFQPKVDAQTLQITGAEALVRWNSRRGVISPADFIPIAEETGLILGIGEWVMAEACAQAVRWQKAGLPAIPIAVNLSARQFTQRDLLDKIRRVLDETGLAPEYLELEITESMIMHQGDSVIDALQNLSTTGIRLAIDDFGTGYSSLAYLKRFPVQDIKIDRSFVRNLTDDPDDAAIVKAIVSMGKSLGLRLIAEGVETPAQLEALRMLGCDTFQGYLFSKPVAADAFANLLRNPGSSTISTGKKRPRTRSGNR